MGNTSVVSSGVKAQGDSASSKVYQLVDLKGGGELVELTKVARSTKKYGDLDEAIKKKVKPFLYNGGKGDNIPINRLVEIRNGHRENSAIKPSKNKVKSSDDLAMHDTSKQENGDGLTGRHDQQYRFQCWNIDNRGTVGETILHLCLLNATQIHSDLAKRILQHFPLLINDIYTGDEYYGETILHQAIVNEDPAMVKFLLDMNADYSIQVCGNFFTPDDQRDSRTDCRDHEWVDLCKKTNYKGYVYWGDYPLSFAACLDQEECVRLLLAKGADPNKQDTNGNTVLHMLVIHDNKEMFNLLHDEKARLDIKNRQGLTPLTLAAKLARKDMFEHILEKMREVYWLFGNVTSAGYPLTDIDTISETGKINTKSALHLIVYGKEDNHLDMMDGVIVKVLNQKWKTFARGRFYRRLACFILYCIVFVTSFALRPGTDLCFYLNDTSVLRGCNQTGLNRTLDRCYLSKPYRGQDIGRFVMEIIAVIGALIYLILAGLEIYHQGWKIFFSTLTAAPAKFIFLISTCLVVLMVFGRAICLPEFEDVIGVLAILCTSPYFLFFFRGFAIIGPSVVMIYNMIRGDLLRFVIIYLVFLMGFSQAVYIPFRTMDDMEFSHPFEVVIGMFSITVGDFEDVYGYFDRLKTPFNQIIKTMFIVYMIMVTLLLVNMLIAMMGRTYETVTSTEKEWFRQWANIVLVMEQTLSTNTRKEQLMAYSVDFKEKERALMIRWHQTEKEKEELRKMRIKNKISQKAMASRMTSIRKNITIDVPEAIEGHQNI